MLTRLILMVLEMVTGFFSLMLLIRFALQWMRLSLRNPIGEFVMSVTNWMVLPLRRVVPGLRGADLSSLLLVWLIQATYLGVALSLAGLLPEVSPGALVNLGLLAVLESVRLALYLVMGVVIIAAVLSWINPNAPLAPLFNALAQPLLRPFQRVIPTIGGVDVSPLVLLLVLQIAMALLGQLFVSLMPALALVR